MWVSLRETALTPCISSATRVLPFAVVKPQIRRPSSNQRDLSTSWALSRVHSSADPLGDPRGPTNGHALEICVAISP
jgi:hypothetical protein